MGIPRPDNLHAKKAKRIVYLVIAAKCTGPQSPLVLTEGRADK
jgi:hypothetical protein